MCRKSGRHGSKRGSCGTMDMRTVEKIEYGSASAVRVPPDAISNLGMPDRFIAFDTETTGLNPDKDCIVELGAVVFEHGVPIETFQSYVNPGVCISEEVSALNHITNEMLQAAPTEEIIYPELMRFLGTAAKGETMICGHVAAFDLSFFVLWIPDSWRHRSRSLRITAWLQWRSILMCHTSTRIRPKRMR